MTICKREYLCYNFNVGKKAGKGRKMDERKCFEVGYVRERRLAERACPPRRVLTCNCKQHREREAGAAHRRLAEDLQGAWQEAAGALVSAIYEKSDEITAIAVIILILFAFGIAGGVERGTLTLPF